MCVVRLSLETFKYLKVSSLQLVVSTRGHQQPKPVTQPTSTYWTSLETFKYLKVSSLHLGVTTRGPQSASWHGFLELS